MKRVVLLLIFILFGLGVVSAEEGTNIIEDKLDDISKNTDIYAEALGQNLLKFQELFMGSIRFISLGFFGVSGDMAFATFLFALLLFMVLHGIVGFIFEKFNFGIAFALTLLAFMSISEEALETLFLNYGAMGITLTMILPVIILLAFTFRIYQRAYEGKSETSPFYAEMFNLGFLIFFGVFFIRYSFSEVGAIAMMRFVSGWVLIGLGLSQTVLYKLAARMFHLQRKDSGKFERDMRKMKKEALDKIKDAELASYK